MAHLPTPLRILLLLMKFPGQTTDPLRGPGQGLLHAGCRFQFSTSLQNYSNRLTTVSHWNSPPDASKPPPTALGVHSVPKCNFHEVLPG